MNLYGEKVFLRPLERKDIDAGLYHKWINDPEVTRYLEARLWPQTYDRMLKYYENIGLSNDNFLMAICINEVEPPVLCQGAHIGNIRLGPINWVHGFAEIGLFIGNKECWGIGYGTEAIRLLSDFAFDQLNLHKLTAGILDPNIGSILAFEKAGFSTEGTLRRQYWDKDRYIDDVVMCKFATDEEQND